MKALREFFVVLLSMALVCTITSLAIIVGVKDIFEGSIVTEGLKEFIKMPEDTENSKEINEAIDKIAEYDGTKDIIDSVLEDSSKATDGNFVLSDKTYDLIIKAIEDNKEELLKMGVSEAEINQSIEEMKNPENRQKANEEISNGFKEYNIQSDTGSNVNAISALTTIVAPSTVNKLIGVIVFIVAAIMLLTFSPYKWIRPVSISSLISGINVLITYYGFDFISKALLENGSNFTVDASKLFSIGMPLFIGGIAGIVIYGVINGLVKKNQVKTDNEPKVEEKKPVLTEMIPEGEKDVPIEEDHINPEKFCAGCGAPVGKEDKVCGSCGAPLD